MKRTTILVVPVVALALALAVTVANAKYDAQLRAAPREAHEMAVDPTGFAGQSIADVFAPRAP